MRLFHMGSGAFQGRRCSLARPVRRDSVRASKGPVLAGNELYRRGRATLLASWEAYARGSPAAEFVAANGFAAGVFPHEPERSFYNNAVLDRGLGPEELRRAIDGVQSVYAAAGVERFAAWAHESDAALAAELSRRGYEVAETTRAMGLSLADVRTRSEAVDGEPLEWRSYLDHLNAEGATAGLLRGVDPAGFHALGVRRAGELVGAAIAFDHDGDCGIFNMSTLEPFRRRGFGTALLLRHLRDATGRGCSTASLQSTPIADGIYLSVGFRDLGRFLEYVPGRTR